VWGRPRDGIRLGEIWFPAHPLLLKFIFTTEKLSVQVHPDDDYTLPRENSLGKTECWYIIDTDPGARLAIGFRRPLTPAQIRQSIQDQTIEKELNWIEVRRGDFIFVPWGTVHAIGPGITLCEVQEFSDITYRMYDYGRRRELHLDKAMDVIRTHPAAGLLQPLTLPPSYVPGTEPPGLERQLLVACRYFALERYVSSEEFIPPPSQFTAPVTPALAPRQPAPFHVLVFIEGAGDVVAGPQRMPYAGEQMWRVPEGAAEYSIAPRHPTTCLKVWVPPSLQDLDGMLERAEVPADHRRRVVIEEL
jgi:mannose-6-phosphate isomerase class I